MKRVYLLGIVWVGVGLLTGGLLMDTANAREAFEQLTCKWGLRTFPGDGAGNGRPLRYLSNGNGTFTDCNTKFRWEEKVSGGEDASCLENIHGVDSACTWFEATGEWLDILNSTCEGEGVVDCTRNRDCGFGVKCGFAGYRDWCIPDIKQLQSIVDYGELGPASSVPGMTDDFIYWSNTTVADESGNAWAISFTNGDVNNSGKAADFNARAVRPCR